MGVQSTISVTQFSAVETIKSLLTEKKSRIVKGTNSPNAIWEKVGIPLPKSNPLLESLLTEEEFEILYNSVEKMTNEQLAYLLEKLEENEYHNYSVW